MQGTGRLEFLVALGGALRGLVLVGDRPWTPPQRVVRIPLLPSCPIPPPELESSFLKPHPRSFRHHFLSTQGFLYSCRSLLSLCRHSSPLLLLVGDSVVGFLGPPIAPIDSSRQTRATPSRKNTQTRTQPSNARSSFHPAYAWPSDNISQSTTSFFLPSRLIEQRTGTIGITILHKNHPRS